ncbi:MAG: VWA domain-containing protein, partial [Planctomycetota bacterium]
MNGLRRMAGVVTLAAVCVGACVRTGAAESRPGGRRLVRERRIDLAICLDTSGSMSGLINSARGKLWQIVSELASAKPSPHLRVALLTYGTPSYGSASGWVRVNLDLTDDLDRVYQELFALRTKGGTEYVARVTRRAVDSLSWDRATDTYRVIFVAGNESAYQDPEFRNEDVCRSAITRDIVVNAIYCGGAGHSDADGYRRTAQLAEGRYASIDQNRGTVTVSTPYDDDLTRLGAELNTTYVAYGSRGRKAAENQREQDSNA